MLMHFMYRSCDIADRQSKLSTPEIFSIVDTKAV